MSSNPAGTIDALEANARALRDPKAPKSGRRATRLADWVSALRLHQWAKNALIFVPLFLGHVAGDPVAWWRTGAGFLAFGLVVSATYLFNDLVDLTYDKAHPTKRFRALAAGRIGIREAGVVALLLLAAGGAAAFALSPRVSGIVAVYVGLTAIYSLRLKREPFIDVAVIGLLFTLRVLMGAVLDGLTPSPWMLSFSAFFFFSLSLAKRHAEVMQAGARAGRTIPGRGYQSGDWPLTLAFGVAAGLASIVVMLLFVALEAQVSGAYRSPQFLLTAPFCVSLWLMRIWLFAHRMTLDDDPVLFAFKDRASYGLGVGALAGFLLAL